MKLKQTDRSIDWERIFEIIDEMPRGKTCDAVLGILDEGKKIMSEYKGMSALDAGLLAAAQAVEHYEMSRYGTLKNLGERTGHEGRRAAS